MAASRFARFLAELKRRHVVRVAIVYAVIGYGIMQAASVFFPALQLPAWTITFVAVLVMLGFPVAVVLAWAFEITPDGMRRTESDGGGTKEHGQTNRNLAYLGVGILVALAGFGLTSHLMKED